MSYGGNGRPDLEEVPLEERLAANRKKATQLSLTFGAAVFGVFAVIFLILQAGLIVSVLLAALVAGLWVGLAWFKSSALILDLCDVAPADPQDHARLFNVTGGLCAAMGLSPPELYVVDDPALNALGVGRDPRRGAVVLTQGLLDSLTVVELEAVVAYQLFRIKSGDTGPETFIIPTFGATSVLAELTDRWQPVSRAFALANPWVESFIQKTHPSRADLLTDLGAVRFTRYPPALATSLEKMRGHSALAFATPVTAHLWAAPLLAPTTHPSLSQLHAPLSERIAVLQEL